MTQNQRQKTGLVLGCCLVAGIGMVSGEPLSLQDCLELAHEQNPLLLAAQQNQQAVEARALQARAIPQLSLDYDSDMQDGILDVTRPGETYLGLSTTVEFPGRRSLRIHIAERETTQGLARLDTARHDLTLEVKTAFFELLLERKKLGFAEKNLELTDQFVELARARFETGDVAEVEVKRALVEQAGAASAQRAAENTAELAGARLALLIGRDCSEPLLIQESYPQSRIPAELTTLTDKAHSSRAEVVELTTAIEREELAEKQAHRGRLPDLDLGVARHWIDGEGSFWDVTLSVPLPIFQQQFRGEIAEAQANQRALRQELEFIKRRIALEVGAAYRRLLTAQERIALYDETLLSEAREVYEMSLFSYSEGAIGGIELIAARRSLLDTNTTYAETLFDHAVSTAELERAVGQNLEGTHQ